MILFHNIVEVLHRTDGDPSPVLGVVAADDRGIGLAPIDGDFLRYAMPADRPGQELLGRWLIAFLRQEELDLDRCFIHPPTQLGRPFTPMESFLRLRTVLHDPPVDRSVIYIDSMFLPQLFDMAIAL